MCSKVVKSFILVSALSNTFAFLQATDSEERVPRGASVAILLVTEESDAEATTSHDVIDTVLEGAIVLHEIQSF